MKYQYARFVVIMFALKVCTFAAVAASMERDVSPIFKPSEIKHEILKEAEDDSAEPESTMMAMR